MQNTTRIQLTLSSDSPQDVGILRHLSQFRTGTGKLDRTFEIKRLLRLALFQEDGGRNARNTPFDSSRIVKRTVEPETPLKVTPPALEKPQPMPKRPSTETAPVIAETDPDPFAGIKESLLALPGFQGLPVPGEAVALTSVPLRLEHTSVADAGISTSQA